MNDVRLKILPPWTLVMRQVEALFDGDPQIACNTDFNGAHPAIVLACNNGDKVAALLQILPTAPIDFGGVQFFIMVDGTPSNRAFKTKKELFETAFSGNPVFAYAVSPVDEGYNWFAITYVVFKNCVVQYFADNLNDCHGIISTLYQNIAEEILTGPGAQGVFFNTDIERANLGKPTGQWP